MTAPELDLAKVDPCPNCGEPVRRMGNVPIAGTSLDPIVSGPWWCRRCLRAKVDGAVAALPERA